MLTIDILTLFPKMFEGPLTESIMWRAKDKGFAQINIHDLRKWSIDKRGTVDDKPYGGGAGMILRIDVIESAIKELRKENSKVILLDARGEKYSQEKAQELSKCNHLILICGHYEGVDQRIADNLTDEVISIGDYVLTGGEIPAMVIADSIVRLIPGVIKKESLAEESFSPSLKIKNSKLKINLEYPQYTRPEDYRGWKVPEVLLSGNHAKIKKFRSGK